MGLSNIEALVDRLSERIEALIEEKGALEREVARLREHVAERDEECARIRQEMAQALEAAAEERARMDCGGTEIETKLQALNDRLIELVAGQQKG